MQYDKNIGELNDRFALSKFATTKDRHMAMLEYMSAMLKRIGDLEKRNKLITIETVMIVEHIHDITLDGCETAEECRDAVFELSNFLIKHIDSELSEAFLLWEVCGGLK
jgi:predicted metal-dependent HD superfamily phosphohydrolase